MDSISNGITPNTRVRVPAEAGRVGMVVAESKGDGEHLYQVFFDQNSQGWYPGSALEVMAAADQIPTVNSVDTIEFLKDVAVAKLSGQLTDTLYSVQSSRTDLVPYQFIPVLKFIKSSDQRLLLADEVGLGKTIEAALIMRELRARGGLDRVLVVCPSRLTRKWRSELQDRFDEEFTIHDASSFDQLLRDYERSNGALNFQGIVSLETFRIQRLIDQAEAVGLFLDLAIVDEAHHMRNPTTATHQVGVALSDMSTAMILLTATPVQLSDQNLYELLHILREDEFYDLDQFRRLREPNTHINNALSVLKPSAQAFGDAKTQLAQVLDTGQRSRYLQDPIYQNVIERLEETANPDWEDVAAIRRDMSRLNTFARIITRTTKREAMTGARRAPYVINVELTAAELDFYEAVLAFTKARYAYTTNGKSRISGFQTVMRERQAASCITAAREYLTEWAMGSLTDLGVEDSSDELLDDAEEGVLEVEFRQSARDLVRTAEHIGDTDTKLDQLLNALRDLRSESPTAKILLFSTFRRTLEYLRGKLEEVSAAESLFHMDGRTAMQERHRLIERFRDSEGFSIFLTSEVGGEGLDFQFSDTLINYDLPWNPMMVEQRIGRLDRFGQEAERIRIYSFVLADTIEERILSRLYDRIGVFKDSIGDLAAILGDEIGQIERKIFSSTLSDSELDEEVEATLQRIAAQRQIQLQLDDQKASLLEQDLLVKGEVDKLLSNGRYVTPEETASLFEVFLKQRYPDAVFESSGVGTWKLRPQTDLAAMMSKAVQSSRMANGRKIEILESLGRPRGFPLTFDNDLARRRPALIYLNLSNPIFEEATTHFLEESKPDPMERLGLVRSDIGAPDESGEYLFFVYLLKITGQQPSSELVPVVLKLDNSPAPDTVAERLFAFISSGSTSNVSPSIESAVEAALHMHESQEEAFGLISTVRTEREYRTKQRNGALIESRSASLKQTAALKLERYRQQINSTRSTRIHRMKEGQIRNTTARLERDLAELELKRTLTVSLDLVLAGGLHLTSDSYVELPVEVKQKSDESQAVARSSRVAAAPTPATRPDEPSVDHSVISESADTTQGRYEQHSTRNGRALNCADAHGKRGVFPETRDMTHAQAAAWWSRLNAPTTQETDIAWNAMRQEDPEPNLIAQDDSTTEKTSAIEKAMVEAASEAAIDLAAVKRIDEALERADALGLEIVDKRSAGGAIWIIDPLKAHGEFSVYGFQYRRKGGRATKKRGAWCLESGAASRVQQILRQLGRT